MNLRNLLWHLKFHHTAQKINYSIKDFFSKCDQIHNTHAEVLLCKATLLKSHLSSWLLRIWSHLLKKSLMENLNWNVMTISKSKLLYDHVIELHLSGEKCIVSKLFHEKMYIDAPRHDVSCILNSLMLNHDFIHQSVYSVPTSSSLSVVSWLFSVRLIVHKNLGK